MDRDGMLYQLAAITSRKWVTAKRMHSSWLQLLNSPSSKTKPIVPLKSTPRRISNTRL